MTIAHPVSTSA